MDQAIVALSQKVDLLTDQVRFLTEQAQLAARRREQQAELMHDVMPIANDIFRLTTEQLEEVQEYVDLGDLLRLIKRLLRNGRNIDTLLDQLESIMDLLQTIGPLTDSAFERLTDLLQTAEQKGYFVFARGSTHIVDTVVTSFSEEDLKQLGENLPGVLDVVKGVTRPETVGLVRGVISGAKVEFERPVDGSVRSLLGQLRDPDVRRGLVLTMRMLRVVGTHAATK